MYPLPTEEDFRRTFQEGRLERNLTWQWDNRPDWGNPGVAIAEYFDNYCYIGQIGGIHKWGWSDPYPDRAVDILKGGQDHNPNVVKLYEKHKYEPLFMTAVGACDNKQANWTNVRTNIQWQCKASNGHRDTVREALSVWNDRRRTADMVWIGFMRHLFDGQSHNPNVQRTYRAALRADPMRLAALVEELY